MKKVLNAFQIKLIAIVTMVIDHAGIIFFPGIIAFRIIGRFAFPLFAFFIAEGYRHTRSVKKYLFRLFLCAVLFQVPDWVFSSEEMRRIFISWGWESVPSISYELNIFATLFLGLSAITLYNMLKEKHIAYSWLAVTAIAVVAQAIGADYGAYGVFYIIVFYIAGTDVKKMLVGGVILHALYAAYMIVFSYVTSGVAAFPYSIQLISLLSIGIIALYNGEQGRKMKYFFYLFYPFHMIVLYGIDALITK
ncbi:MAG: TraX family protein [Clostridiaceae bacterium]|nr:TraX family protein [Clostridiaceae bacterium]